MTLVEQTSPERILTDELLRQHFNDCKDEGFEPAYAMFWTLKGDTFEVVADYVTDERRKVLRAKRGDDDTFCAMSRGIRLQKDGDGPVATAFHEQRSTMMQTAGVADQADNAGPLSRLKNLFGIFGRGSAEFGVGQMTRAELAREFDIEAIRFYPTEDGVVEIGRAPQKWDELMRRKFEESRDEGFSPAYAMFWELKGDTFEIVADYVTDERRRVLRAKRGDDISFCSMSKGTMLPKDGAGPVATAFREQRPTMVLKKGGDDVQADSGGKKEKISSARRVSTTEFGFEQMKRAELAREFDIESIRWEPTEDGVVEIGRAPQIVDLPGAAAVRRVAFSTQANIADTLLLVISGFIFTLQTVPNFLSPEVDLALRLTEDTIIVIFALEFFARWYGKDLSLKFLTEPFSIVDILSFAPFLTLLSLKYYYGDSDADPLANTLFETVGLLRVLRLQTFVEDLESFENSAGVVVPNIRVREWQLELARVGISLFTLVTVFAGIFYTCEHEVNPSMVDGFDSLYFSIVTLTTVGFGDVNVITPAGRFALCCYVIGAAAVIPAQLARLGEALIADDSERFALRWAESEERFKQFDLNKDGYMDVYELEKLCVAAGLDRPAGNARALASKVFVQMDANGDGRLDLWEFDRKLPRFLQAKLMQIDQLPDATVKEDEDTTADSVVGVVLPTAITARAKLLELEEARDLLTDEEYARARSKIVDSFGA